MRIRPPLFEVIRRVAYWEAPADYIIFKDGDLVMAKNGRTGVIEYSSTKLSEVLTKINDSIPELPEYERLDWEIVTKPTVITFYPDRYVLDAPVKLKGGILLDLNGSWLDISQIDDVAITIGNYWEDENSPLNKFWINQLTGVVNGMIRGDETKTNQWAVKTIGISGGLVLRNVKFDPCHGGIWLQNLNYDPVIENVDFRRTPNAIKAISIDDDHAVNDLRIDNCFVLGPSPQGEVGVSISQYCENVTITNTWFERLSLAIEDHGKYTKITNNQFGRCSAIYTDGSFTQILNNYISSGGDNAVLIELAGQYEVYRIENNHLYIPSGADTTIIKVSNKSRVNITGNTVYQAGTGNSYFIDASNGLERSVISSNIIYNSNQEGIAFKIGGNSTNLSITGNLIDGFNYHFSGIPSYSVIEGNMHNNYASDILQDSVNTTTYFDKVVYTELPDTSNAKVSSIFKNKPITVHDVDGSITGTTDSWWIFTWDGSTWRKVQLT